MSYWATMKGLPNKQGSVPDAPVVGETLTLNKKNGRRFEIRITAVSDDGYGHHVVDFDVIEELSRVQ